MKKKTMKGFGSKNGKVRRPKNTQEAYDAVGANDRDWIRIKEGIKGKALLKASRAYAQRCSDLNGTLAGFVDTAETRLKEGNLFENLPLGKKKHWPEIAARVVEAMRDTWLGVRFYNVEWGDGMVLHMSRDCVGGALRWELNAVPTDEFMDENFHIDTTLYPRLWKYLWRRIPEIIVRDLYENGVMGAIPILPRDKIDISREEYP